MSKELIKKDEYGCTLFIETGEDSPNTISNMLEFQPTEIVTKGSPKYNKAGKLVIGINDRNLWILKIDKQYGNEQVYLNRPIELMLDILDLKRGKFIDVLTRYPQNHLLCYAYFYDCNPYFLLSKDTIKRLNIYSIDLEFDLYNFSEEGM